MKRLLLIATVLLVNLNLFAQSNSIPNPSFENWMVLPYTQPINCQSSNGQNVQNGSPLNVFRVADPYHGKYAVQMKTVKFGNDTIGAYFALGNPGGGGPTGGSPITGIPTGLRVYYKLSLTAADTAIIIVEFKKGGSIVNQYFYQINDSTSTYKLFSQTFSPAVTPGADTIIIAAATSTRITSSGNNNGGSSAWAPGSIFEVDSMTFTGPTSQPANFDGDFENWQSDTSFTLQGWNIYQNGDSLPIRTTDAYAGKYAVELTTSLSNCNSCSSPIQANSITTGKPSKSSNPTGGQPYNLQKDTLEFVYKYGSKGNPRDSAQVYLNFHNNSNQMGYNIYLDTASHYRKVDFPFDLTTLFTPDSVLINITSSVCNNCSGLPGKDEGAVLKVDSMHFKSQLPVAITPINPAFCSGTGGVKLTANGGTTYTWSPSSGLSATTGATVTANPFSTTTYTVTGTKGSLIGSQIVTVTVSFPPTVNITPTSASICSGNSVNLTASGTSVSYAWSPSTGLSATTGATVSANPGATQTYNVTGTSAAGCTGANSVAVTVTTTPALTVTPSSAVICGGSGSVVLKANGATNYVWTPATILTPATGASVTCTTTVTTTVIVIGSNGSCADTAKIPVTVDSPIQPNLTSTNVTCNGSCNGTAATAVTGGTPSYTYSWNTTPVQTSSSVNNLCPATYSVTITDGDGCKIITPVTISQPAVLQITAIGFNTTCGQTDGQGTVVAKGGTTPYSYDWSTVPAQTNASINNLAPGTYTIVVNDANKCTDTSSVTVGASSSPAITVKVTPTNCGTHNGIATASVTGGTAPFKYSWNNGGTKASDDSLAAGVYIITVTDNTGCSSFQAVTVGDTNGPTLSVTAITQNKCYGQSNGAISVTATGGKAPYRYTWSTGATTTSISGLPAGPYQITVTDATSCSDVKTINITAPAAITLTTVSTQANCKTSNGGASVTASGGTSPYMYSWNNAATTSAVSNIAAGTYSVYVTDNNGCIDSADVSVSNTAGPVVKITSITNDSCTALGNSGSISISDSGGVMPYNYLWSNNATTSNIAALAAGAYAVTVTDASGCIGTINATVNQIKPAAISICMVTVNPVNNENQIIWDKTTSTRIEKYNVYKETTSPGVFGFIGSVKSDSTGIYIDSLSNALVRSWRYEISQVDSCGNESPLSLPHKTMHLTINGTSTVNLIWDNYQGLSFGYYIIYRDTMPGIVLDSLNYMTNNGTYTFTDTPPYSATHSWYYHMGINNPGGCNPAIEAVNYNTSKSNSGNITLASGIPQVDNEINSLEIFPNPSTGMVNMSIALDNGTQNLTVKVINTMGQTLWTNNYNDVSGNVKKQLDFSMYSKGMYIIQVTTNNSSIYKKVVIQ